MNKKGFTLIELLGAVVVLGIIGLIVFPTVNSIINNNKEKSYQAQLEEIRLATEKWAYENIDSLPTQEYEEDNNALITLTIADLKKAGLLPIDLKNPKTSEIFPNDMIITIKFVNNKYVYEIDENSGTDLDNVDNLTGPTLILNGGNIVYAEIGSDYEELGANITSSTGSSNVNIIYQYNGKEVGEIDTSYLRTYTVIYYATDETGTSKVIRTVIVRDTTAPEIIGAIEIDVNYSDIDSFDPLSGITVKDNSGETIQASVSNFDKTVGDDKIITYSACDSSNNCTEVRRILNIKE